MRSLVVLTEQAAALAPLEPQASQIPAACITVDTDSNHVYAAVAESPSSTTVFRIVEALNGVLDVAEVVSLPDGDLLPAVPDASIEVAGMQFQPESQSLCIAMRSGEILVARFDGPEGSAPVLESVGIIDSGIRTMAWSPDLELVLFVTGVGTILEMTKEFDVIAEVPISVDDKGEAMRTIRVYNREAVLQNTSEYVAQLEHPLSWRPSGNLIAATQRLPHRHDVVFFERNGLRHGEFTLRNAADIVVDLHWNADSSMLAVRLARTQGSAADAAQVPWIIQIWTCNNYYWYLKQELRTNAPGDSFATLLWDPETPGRLHTVSAGARRAQSLAWPTSGLSDHRVRLAAGEYSRFQFATDVLTSTSLSPNNAGVVAVVDGTGLLLTPFRTRNVPPPMSFARAEFPAPVKFVAFSAKESVNAAAVLLADNSIVFLDKIDRSSAEIEHMGVLQLPTRSGIARQIAWFDETTILALEHSAEHGNDRVVVYSLSLSEKTFTVTKTTEIPHADRRAKFIRLHHNVALGVAALQTSTGKVFEISRHEGEWFCTQRHTFPNVSPWMASVRVGATPDTKELVWLGMSERNKLFANDQTLLVDCTSFFVHNEFLVVTTLSHTARFLPLSVAMHEFHFAENSSATGLDEQIRRVERGSQIVLAVPSSVTLVLQMPRGNLETVCPRAFVLATVRHAIDRLDYKSAFMTCRKHRIDMNILVDHDAAKFVNHVRDFVRQIDDTDHFNLFISSLRDEDVTATMYQTREPSLSRKDVSGKVNELCDLMVKVLDEAGTDKFIQSILTSYARKKPPNLEGAMRRIYSIKETRSSDAAESALKYLIFLADVDKLYDVALGMYDFPLVLMVAQHSQKDPRDYLPFLSELQKLPKFYQRFRIDDHLGRRESALENLSQAGAAHFDEAVQYMRRHQLYKKAMTLYEQDTEHHQTILLEFADFHASNNAYDEAALLYEMAGSLERALEAYTLAGSWQEATTLAVALNKSGEEQESMAESLIEILLERRDYAAVSRLCLDVLKNPERAVEALADGSQWRDAVLVATMHNLAHLKQATIKPALMRVATHTLEEIKEMAVTFDKQRSRLREVREEKKKKQELAAAGGVPDDRLDDIDLFSDTASMATTRVTGTATASRASTAASTRTGAAGKDAAFEDEYLITMLHKAVTRSRALGADMPGMLRALMQFGETLLAREVQMQFKRALEVIRAGYGEIFEPPASASTAVSEPAAAAPLQSAGGAEGAAADEAEAAQSRPAAVLEKPAMLTDKWWTDSLEI
ncbi:putative elongator complex protein 1 [Polyrhizophydium stewartii]|uniref:Elongator complex protein 1 n=1 Tax=Polyrhizophydium stewartii TaxID=2732419 RepID=A0ABR4MWI3_9FUNG